MVEAGGLETGGDGAVCAGGAVAPSAWMAVVALTMTGCHPLPAPTVAYHDDAPSLITYHNNASRTGWAGQERTLTPANVAQSTFGLIAHTDLDGQVDAQPLVALQQRIAGGTHDVAYVVTSRNTVYAIDASSGAVLRSVNLGPPVRMPLNCDNNDTTVGITSTPVLDVDNRALYVMAYVLPSPSAAPIYQLHALDPATLADRVGSPVTVTASHRLTDHTVHRFDASVQRQRPALLYASGNIYAGFGSFCDYSPETSRGWVLGWKASTLVPLARNVLVDRLAPPTPAYTLWDGTTHQPFFLAEVWMSGYGPSADERGNVYFVTGNGNGLTYDGVASLQESAVKVSPDLSTVLDYFTPSNAVSVPDGLDAGDTDFGSGGLMVLPEQRGRVPHLAMAAGKDGRMFILNRDHMGKFHDPEIPTSVDIGECYCGPSYFLGSDGIGRVVTSGGKQVKTWKLNTARAPTLVLEGTSPALDSGQDGGIFTTVSSSHTAAGTQIIWAIGRPIGAAHQITLYAISGTPVHGTLPLLWSGVAGSWPNITGNAYLVPTVAGGRVYVASYHELAIFGLLPTGRVGISPEVLVRSVPSEEQPPGARVWGTVREVGEHTLVIQLRDDKLLTVDLAPARNAGAIYIVPTVGSHVTVRGTLNDRGVVEASAIARARGPAKWGIDKLR